MMNRIQKTLKALQELGWKKMLFYGLYRFGLRSGHYQRVTPSHQASKTGQPGLAPYTGFPEIPPEGTNHLLQNARQVLEGQITIFGAEPTPWDVRSGASDQHWTALEKTPPQTDIKFIWEPGRFGWALTLARAYAASRDEAFAAGFWEKALAFLDAHPPNLGRQWQSAQEVALRLMVLIFCDRVFANANNTTPKNRQRLWQAIAEHAGRIPPTLIYARAQNNNHLLSEAAGLYAAGCYLPEAPQAAKWRQLGWRWLNWGFQNQIDENGAYIQHSVNYHRLMLQLALFCDHLRRLRGKEIWPQATQNRLAASTRWLWALTDPKSGQAPNLGANDGAYIFPLTNQPFHDFRPVVDAAVKAFLQEDIYQQPDLAQMAAWWNLTGKRVEEPRQPQAPDMLRLRTDRGRAFLRTAHFTDRPSHADQLHADLWWQGVNVALDPGTFQYNADPPWDNALVTARVHNTLTVDGQDQMLRAGRFLWLAWAQAQALSQETDSQGRLTRLTAEHNGYRRLGIAHQRTLAAKPDGWDVIDLVRSSKKAAAAKRHTIRLSWLLPDWPWQIETPHTLRLTGPTFNLHLSFSAARQLALFRAGENLTGHESPQPTWGWVSPTYSVRQPALMVVVTLTKQMPIKIASYWRFDNEKS